MTYTTKPNRNPRVATYRERVNIAGERRDLTCIRGTVEETRALRDQTVAGAPGAVVRYETFNYGLNEMYVEIIMPQEVSS
jgi:hypothetical protein